MTANNERIPIASRLSPHQTETTYFGSGRAAFTYLLSEVIKPKVVYLPTFICWSLVDAMISRFPKCRLLFYSVDRSLRCSFPDDPERDSLILLIHYFGKRCTGPVRREGVCVLEDLSHTVMTAPVTPGNYAFGSLRKVYRTADGGFLRGRYNPVYEADRKLDSWLRYLATDWREMREAENMTDRAWTVCDMSSQSLAVTLQTDEHHLQATRRANNRFLAQHLKVGRPMQSFDETDCPLLHNRLMNSTDERDSLRSCLADHGIFCSIHWPIHPAVLQDPEADTTEAVWLANHVLSIPVSEQFGEREMTAIVRACEDWS